jgi:hypothetical protein
MSAPTNANSLRSNAAYYTNNGIAAGIAVIPVFHGLKVKSTLQVGLPWPKLSYATSLKEGMKAAPLFAATVAGQTLLLDAGIKFLPKLIHLKEPKKEADWKITLLSAVIAGAVSSPFYAIFNGQSNGLTFQKSLQVFSLKQFTALTGRESSFLLSIKIVDPLSQTMKKKFGESAALDHSVAFTSGVVGSLVGHLPDTILSRSQKGLPTLEKYSIKGYSVVKVSTFFLGAPVRALTLGFFNVGYNFIQRNLKKE